MDLPRVRRLGEAEAGAHRAGRDERAVQPRVQLRGQRGRLGFVSRRDHGQASIGAGQCDHVPFGQRNVSRSTASPRGQEGTGQAGARRGVGEPVERGGQQDGRRVPGHGPARGGHGGGQVTRALHVRAAQHRAPAGRVALVLGDQDRQHPAARRQAVGEARQRGQVRQRGAPLRQLAEAGVPAKQQVQRGGRGEGQDRHPPASQPDPPGPGFRRVRRAGACGAAGRTSSGEASGRGGAAADGSCSVSSPSTALRAASPAGPGRRASRSASSPAWQANGCGAGSGARPGGAAGRRRVLRPQAERSPRPYPVQDPHDLHGNKEVGQSAPETHGSLPGALTSDRPAGTPVWPRLGTRGGGH